MDAILTVLATPCQHFCSLQFLPPTTHPHTHTQYNPQGFFSKISRISTSFWVSGYYQSTLWCVTHVSVPGENRKRNKSLLKTGKTGSMATALMCTRSFLYKKFEKVCFFSQPAWLWGLVCFLWTFSSSDHFAWVHFFFCRWIFVLAAYLIFPAFFWLSPVSFSEVSILCYMWE